VWWNGKAGLECRNMRQWSRGCSSARGTEVSATAQWQQREHKIATEVASASQGFQTSQDVSIWGKSVTYFLVTKLQCSS